MSESTVFTWPDRPMVRLKVTVRREGGGTALTTSERPARKGDTVTADCPTCEFQSAGLCPGCGTETWNHGTVQVTLTTDPSDGRDTPIQAWTAEGVIEGGNTDG